MLNTSTFATNFVFIWIFSYSHLSSPLVVTKHQNCQVLCINRMSLHKRITQNVLNQLNIKRNYCFVVNLLFYSINNGQKSLTRFISSCLTTVQLIIKNSESKKVKSLRFDSNPQSLGFEATEHLCNRTRIENCRDAFNC